MPTFREGKLLFDFPADWQVVHYDRDADLATGTAPGFYRRVVTNGGVKQVQAIDFVCLPVAAPKKLLFLEIKDDRLDTRAEGERRTQLYEAVLSKVASTLAGLLLAERLRSQLPGDEVQPLACLSELPLIEVALFWLEPPVPSNTLRRVVKKDGKTLLQQRLTAKLLQWDMPFTLYNLTDADRLPLEWQAREV